MNYGFIQFERSEKDIFVHKTELSKSGIDNLENGEIVDFDVGEGPNNKPVAINVSRVDFLG